MAQQAQPIPDIEVAAVLQDEVEPAQPPPAVANEPAPNNVSFLFHLSRSQLLVLAILIVARVIFLLLIWCIGLSDSLFLFV